MSDLRAIADALAARFAGVTATVGIETESIAVGPTARLPNSLGKGPILLVDLPTGELDVRESANRWDIWHFPVRLLRDPANVPARVDWLYAWLNAMRGRVDAQNTLGLADYVANASPSRAALDLDGYPYASVDGTSRTFDVVELIVDVQLYEHDPNVAA